MIRLKTISVGFVLVLVLLSMGQMSTAVSPVAASDPYCESPPLVAPVSFDITYNSPTASFLPAGASMLYVGESDGDFRRSFFQYGGAPVTSTSGAVLCVYVENSAGPVNISHAPMPPSVTPIYTAYLNPGWNAIQITPLVMDWVESPSDYTPFIISISEVPDTSPIFIHSIENVNAPFYVIAP